MIHNVYVKCPLASSPPAIVRYGWFRPRCCIVSTDRIKTTLTPCHNHRFVLRDRATAKNGDSTLLMLPEQWKTKVWEVNVRQTSLPLSDHLRSTLPLLNCYALNHPGLNATLHQLLLRQTNTDMQKAEKCHLCHSCCEEIDTSKRYFLMGLSFLFHPYL